jgi:hypothetical protein
VSYAFFVSTPAPVDLRTVVQSLGLEVVCREEDEIDAGLGDAIAFHFHRPGLSTRGVTISYDSESCCFEARALVAASEADFELALRFCEAAARACGASHIEAEDGDLLEVGVRGRFDAGWAGAMLASSVEALLAVHRREGGDLTLSGPVRDFIFGRRCAVTLQAADVARRGEHLRSMILAVQFPPEDLYVASVIAVDEGRRGGMRLAACGADLAYFFGPVDALALVDDDHTDAPPTLVAFEHAERVFGDRWAWLDDGHATLTAIGGAEWRHVLRRARDLPRFE